MNNFTILPFTEHSYDVDTQEYNDGHTRENKDLIDRFRPESTITGVM
jgi:hypothetical protein